MNGYAGRILRLDLTHRKISSIDTRAYEAWGGGHGMGSAIFFDLVKDKKIRAFDPRNVVTIMTSPLTGTLAPSTSRTEVQGIGAQSYPFEWFTRSNFGGRFGPMLKYAGWDGIVIEGKADKPIWVDIRNDQVTIKDGSSLWGLDSWETQQQIWREVSGGDPGRDWMDPVSKGYEQRTTQRPAVLTIGPAGENLSRIAALIHDSANGAGQGGFGGVWGSKNLKAISVVGTGSIDVADPRALLKARHWFIKDYMYNVNHPVSQSPVDNLPIYGIITKAPGYGPLQTPVSEPSRASGCQSCPQPCGRRSRSGAGNGSTCIETYYHLAEGPKKAFKAADLLQKLGVNAAEMWHLPQYLMALYNSGFLGPGREINSHLPFDQYGKMAFAEALAEAVAYRKDIGMDLAEGVVRAAKKWGRLEQDLKSGLLLYPAWGYWEHFDPCREVEWSYGTLLGDRDINEHCINWEVFGIPNLTAMAGGKPFVSAEKLVNMIAEKLLPYQDPDMLDYSPEGIYSQGKVKMIAWHRHYTRFWKQSVLYCDWVFPDFINVNHPKLEGFTPEAEPRFFNAVTGKNMTFEEGMELGKKIWNLDRSVWALQGRHRDNEVFADYIYEGLTVENPSATPTYLLPVKENGTWLYSNTKNCNLDRARFEDWKTRYYQFEQWDSETGRPTRKTLDSLGMRYVADELEKHLPA